MMQQYPAIIRRAGALVVTLALVTACSGGGTTNGAPLPDNVSRTVSAAGWDSLPAVRTTDGSLVCLSDGQSPCPFDAATANWIAANQFAVWQRGRLVHVWTGGKTDPMPIGDIGANENQYQAVIAVASTASGFVILETGPFGARAMFYDRHGAYQSNHPIPEMRPTFATAYSGPIAMLQSIHAVENDSVAVFEIRELDSPGDTVGVSVLKQPLPWLTLRNGRPAHALPLFPTIPSFSFAADSDIVWSIGTTRSVQRISRNGKVRWTISSPATGGPVSDADIAAARAQLPPDADPSAKEAFDSSAARTPRLYPAVVALYTSPDDRVLLASRTSEVADSVSYYLVDRNGAPTGRTMLQRRAHPLLFAGDSILVQRPGANAAPELRWIRLGGK